jgi:hypothetical protein
MADPPACSCAATVSVALHRPRVPGYRCDRFGALPGARLSLVAAFFLRCLRFHGVHIGDAGALVALDHDGAASARSKRNRHVSP